MGRLHVTLIVRVSNFEINVPDSIWKNLETEQHRELVSGVTLVLPHTVVQHLTLSSGWRVSILSHVLLNLPPPDAAHTVAILPSSYLVVIKDVTRSCSTIHKVHVVQGEIRCIIIMTRLSCFKIDIFRTEALQHA